MTYPYPIRSSQFTLAELFYVRTLSAVAIGVYLYISPLLAVAGDGALVVVAAVHWIGSRNLLTGGLSSFLVSSILSGLLIVVCNVGSGESIVVILLFPSTGYILGALTAELSNVG